jgi:hypothetical protein
MTKQAFEENFKRFYYFTNNCNTDLFERDVAHFLSAVDDDLSPRSLLFNIARTMEYNGMPRDAGLIILSDDDDYAEMVVYAKGTDTEYNEIFGCMQSGGIGFIKHGNQITFKAIKANSYTWRILQQTRIMESAG